MRPDLFSTLRGGLPPSPCPLPPQRGERVGVRGAACSRSLPLKSALGLLVFMTLDSPAGHAEQVDKRQESVQSPKPAAARFVNVAGLAGIDFTYYNDAKPGRFFLPEIMGGGAAWLDYDGDGWVDLFLVNGC